MATIYLYQNTGFNLVDIPESLDLVKSDANLYRRYTDGNVIQAQGLSNVIVDNITSVDAASIDFIIVRDDDGLEVGYNVLDNFQFVAPQTCQFFITEAALTTILENMIVVSASANRMHIEVDEDDTEFFSNPEPFEPALSYVIGTSPIDDRFPISNPNCTNILETTVAPPEMITNTDQGTIIGSNTVVQQNYTADNTFATRKKGTKYRNTTPVVTTIEDSNHNVMSQSVLSTVEPEFRPITPTVYNINKLFEGAVSIYTGSNYWVNGATQVVNQLTSVGMANGITSYWAVPTAYIKSITDAGYSDSGASAGGVSIIESDVFNKTVPLNGPTFGVFHNNKVYYGQALTITIFNPISGARLTHQVHEVRDENQFPGDIIEGSYSITADIRPDGAPIFSWKCKNGLPLIGFPETIEGGSWRRIPISADTYGGSFWDRRQLEMQKKLDYYGDETGYKNKASIGFQSGVITNIGSSLGMGAAGAAIMGNPLTLPAATVAGAIGITSATGAKSEEYGKLYKEMSRAYDIQTAELSKRAEVATPVITLSTSNYLREIGYNSFYWMVTSYSQEDLHAFDTFLTKYGYNVGSKAFAKSDFYSRPYFNYVRLNNIIMKTPDFSMYLRNIAEQELMRGVRVWHELPNLEAIEDGNKD